MRKEKKKLHTFQTLNMVHVAVDKFQNVSCMKMGHSVSLQVIIAAGVFILQIITLEIAVVLTGWLLKIT